MLNGVLFLPRICDTDVTDRHVLYEQPGCLHVLHIMW